VTNTLQTQAPASQPAVTASGAGAPTNNQGATTIVAPLATPTETVVPPQGFVASGSAINLAELAVTERRAQRRLNRISLVLHDYAADDHRNRSAAGYTLLSSAIALTAGAAIVGLAPLGISPSTRELIAVTYGGTGVVMLIPAFVLLFRQTAYENMSAALDQDTGTAQQRYSAALSRWQTHVASERNSQRIGAITMIISGLVVGLGGAAEILLTTSGSSAGIVQLPSVLGVSVPFVVAGVYMLNLRGESERSLRAFQLAQGAQP
jgi:hypothetical protein